MNPVRSVGVERGWKAFYDVLLATERKCCDCTSSHSIDANRICKYVFSLGAACHTVRNMRQCFTDFGNGKGTKIASIRIEVSQTASTRHQVLSQKADSSTKTNQTVVPPENQPKLGFHLA